MNDTGSDGDAVAGDGIYSVVLPASVQQHRRLVRYRIIATDTSGNPVQVPYADDPQPNFAYFVYDGVPGWSGADEPGVSEVVEYDAEVMRVLPTYRLATNLSKLRATPLRIAGAPRGSWAGVQREFRRPSFTSDDGALVMMLKQARAHGLGLVLATQNPVDVDYKALSNCGTWMLGRLQTERDVARALRTKSPRRLSMRGGAEGTKRFRAETETFA